MGFTFLRLEHHGLITEAGDERPYGYCLAPLRPVLDEFAKREGVTPLSRFTREEKDLLAAFSEEAADDSDEITRDIYLSSRGDWFPVGEMLASVRALQAIIRNDPDLVECYEEVTGSSPYAVLDELECPEFILSPSAVLDELECLELILVRADAEGLRVRLVAQDEL